MEDKTYDKIISYWNDFIDCIPDDEDKQLFLKITSKCYFKYQKSIKAYGISDFELSNGTVNVHINRPTNTDQWIEA